MDLTRPWTPASVSAQEEEYLSQQDDTYDEYLEEIR